MTEDEAKAKWCPLTRVSGDGVEWHSNRPSIAEVDKKGFDLCIASACMAWRPTRSRSLIAAKIYAEDGAKLTAIKALREVFNDLGLIDAKDIVEGKRPWPEEPEAGGGCGLAGAPQ